MNETATWKGDLNREAILESLQADKALTPSEDRQRIFTDAIRVLKHTFISTTSAIRVYTVPDQTWVQLREINLCTVNTTVTVTIHLVPPSETPGSAHLYRRGLSVSTHQQLTVNTALEPGYEIWVTASISSQLAVHISGVELTS